VDSPGEALLAAYFRQRRLTSSRTGNWPASTRRWHLSPR